MSHFVIGSHNNFVQQRDSSIKFSSAEFKPIISSFYFSYPEIPIYQPQNTMLLNVRVWGQTERGDPVVFLYVKYCMWVPQNFLIRLFMQENAIKATYWPLWPSCFDVILTNIRVYIWPAENRVPPEKRTSFVFQQRENSKTLQKTILKLFFVSQFLALDAKF